MADQLKVVSGVIFTTDRQHGEVVLDFATNTVTGDGNVYTSGQDAQHFGPDTKFASEPCKVVSLRWLRVPDAGGGDFNLSDYYVDANRRESIRIVWDAPKGGEIREISYMFVGYASGK
ncbi:MAG: hypothetical protein GY838_14760 [bacterium]|nr:hypothetical protein [bacterium]